MSSATPTEKLDEIMDLKKMARQSAEMIPAKTLPPMEIQGYLPMHQKNPYGALENGEERKEGPLM
jgi:hypothetical protein